MTEALLNTSYVVLRMLQSLNVHGLSMYHSYKFMFMSNLDALVWTTLAVLSYVNTRALLSLFHA